MNNLREEEFSFEGDFRDFFLFIVLGSVDSGPVMRQNTWRKESAEETVYCTADQQTRRQSREERVGWVVTRFDLQSHTQK